MNKFPLKSTVDDDKMQYEPTLQVEHSGDMNQNHSREETCGDVEKNEDTVNGKGSITPTPVHIPTRMEIFYDLNGSLGFVIGSSGFILAMHFENWLPYFRYGSLAWIWGCVFYCIPLLQKIKVSQLCSSNSLNLNDELDNMNNKNDIKNKYVCPWDVGDFGEFLCNWFWFIGCILGGFFNEEMVERFIPAINHTFLYGSFSLALKPVYQLILFLRRGCCHNSRMRDTKLKRGPSSATTSISSDVDNNNEQSNINMAAQPKINWDWYFELGAMIFFCGAGIFGGFPPHPSLALPGVYLWEVGSLFGFARSILMIRKRSLGSP